MKRIINWLITSSADPRKTSLALKGVLMYLAAQLLVVLNAACGFGLYCAGIDADGLNQIVELTVAIVNMALTLVGLVLTLWGLLRKIAHGRWSAAHI